MSFPNDNLHQLFQIGSHEDSFEDIVPSPYFPLDLLHDSFVINVTNHDNDSLIVTWNSSALGVQDG